MKSKTLLILAIPLTLITASCNRTIPAGFWEDYETKLLVTNISDQGPYGGHIAIYWKSDKLSGFHTGDILDFAIKNGWTLADSAAFGQLLTGKWIYDNKQVFPLSSTGFNDKSKTFQHTIIFPGGLEEI